MKEKPAIKPMSIAEIFFELERVTYFNTITHPYKNDLTKRSIQKDCCICPKQYKLEANCLYSSGLI